MKIRIAKAFRGYKVGQVFDWADGMCRIFIGRGMVEEVRDEPEAAAVEERCERAFIDSRPKKKKP
jgi:hypothetical protein